MSGILWIILIGVIAIVALGVAADIGKRRNFARHADGTPISYDEFDGMIRDFDRQRELLYGIPPDNDDEHGRIRDEIRRNRPQPKLTALVGLVLIGVVAACLAALVVANSDPDIVASANQFALVGEGWLWAGLGVALVVGVVIGGIGRATNASPAIPVVCGVILAGLFYVVTGPGMMGEGVVAVFGSAVGAGLVVMAGAMVPATVIMSLH